MPESLPRATNVRPAILRITEKILRCTPQESRFFLFLAGYFAVLFVLARLLRAWGVRL